MANRKARVVRSVKVDGEWKFLSLEKGRKLKIPNDEGRWYVTWREGSRKRWKRAADYGAAYTLQVKKDAELHAKALGIQVDPEDPKRLTLKKAVDEIIEDLELRSRSKRTIGSYKLALGLFKGPTYLDQIERIDLLRYADNLRKEGLSERTVANRWFTLLAFLKHFNIKGLVTARDTPRFVEAEPETYTKDEMEKFFSACKKDDQHLLFEFLLKTGARMQEAMYCIWADLDLKGKAFTVRANSQFGFRPKSWEERTIPLEDRLAVALEKRGKHRKRSELVFPTRNAKPNTKMLLMCKAIAGRAGLDKEIFWLHKFRATFATWHLHSGVDIRTVQMWLGHKDIASTMRYLQPARGKAINAKFNATFAGM